MICDICNINLAYVQINNVHLCGDCIDDREKIMTTKEFLYGIELTNPENSNAMDEAKDACVVFLAKHVDVKGSATDTNTLETLAALMKENKYFCSDDEMEFISHAYKEFDMIDADMDENKIIKWLKEHNLLGKILIVLGREIHGQD